MTKLRIDRGRVEELMWRKRIKSFAELAKLADVHANTLTVVLNGGSWSARTAEKLAEALDCNPIDLMVAEGYPEPFSAAPVGP